MEIVPKNPGQQRFHITSSGSAFPRMISKEGVGLMWTAEVFLTAVAEDGTISNVAMGELRFDRPELFDYLLKHIKQIVGPQMEAAQRKQKEAESLIELPSRELVAKLQH